MANLPSLHFSVHAVTRCLHGCADTGKGFFEAHPGLWSFLSALSAFLYLGVSALGLFFVWGQLKASRGALTAAADSARAAAEAAQISYTATRPWLKFNIHKAHIFLSPHDMDRVGCQLDYTVINIGRSPAIQVELRFRPIPIINPNPADLTAEVVKLRDEQSNYPDVLFPGDKIEQGRSGTFPFPPQRDESFMGFAAVAAMVYRAEPSGELYWTPAVITLQHETPPADRRYRFWRGMGPVPCLALLSREHTPVPT